ncbi:trypsin-1-like isoform X2 [Salvelinus alpinus]
MKDCQFTNLSPEDGATLSYTQGMERTAQTVSYQNRKRSGRPRCTTEQEDNYIEIKKVLVTAALEEDDTIVGGYECRKNSVPYQVFLYTGYNFCGGILLSSEWVLSAAHCYKSLPLEVCLGEHNIKEPENTEQHIMSARFIRHPDYNSGTQDSDIALIKLSQPATLNSYVSPVALPTKCGTAGTMCQVSGWGAFVPATKA